MNDMEIKRRLFAEWLSLPKGKRVPRTQIEFAKEHDIAREVLSRWKKEPKFKEEVADAGLDWFSSDDIAEIVYALKKKAKDGNPSAIKMCLEMSGVITDGRKEVEDITPDALSGMDFKQLEKLANEGMPDE